MPLFRGIVTLFARAAPAAFVRPERTGVERPFAAGLIRIAAGAR